MDSDRKTEPRPLRPRFGMGILLVVMFVCALMAAPGYYFVRGIDQRDMKVVFIILTLSAPALLVVVVALAHRLFRWWTRIRR